MTIRRKLHCTDPNCPHETLKIMSDWVREKLPDSYTGYMVSDVDFVLWNYKSKRVMLLEVKTHGAECKAWQRTMWKNLNRWIANGIDTEWTYLGFHLLVFYGKDFNGKVEYDYREISESDLIKILSLEETQHD